MSASLKLVREHPLAEAATCSLLGRRVSINELPWIYRTILRWVFRRVHWASSPNDCNHSNEIQMVATHGDIARRYMKPGWYLHENIPVNVLFPEETCKVGTMEFKNSPMNTEYASIPVDTVAVKIRDLDDIYNGFNARIEKIGQVLQRARHSV